MINIARTNTYAKEMRSRWRDHQQQAPQQQPFTRPLNQLPSSAGYIFNPLFPFSVMPKEVFAITDGLKGDGREMVFRAFEKANSAFAGMERKSGRPFIDHLVDTALIIRQAMEIKDPVLLAAGLLHDIREDTPVTYEELKREFGREVADLVEAETKLSKELLQGERREFENLKKWIKAMVNDPRVALLKAADNASNMRDQEVFPKEKRIEHALETSEIYIPIMEAMGVWEMREMLGNAAIRYLQPEEYSAALPVYQAALAKGEGLFEPLRNGIGATLGSKGFRSPFVEIRQRSLYEVFRKMEKTKKKIEELLAENPLMLNYVSVELGGNKSYECYRAMALLRAKVLHRGQQALAGFKPRDEKIEDWIAVPRPDNFQALQTYFFKEGVRGKLLVTISSHWMKTSNRLGLAAFGAAKPLDPDWYKKNYDWLGKLFEYIQRVSSARQVRSLIREMTYQTNFYTENADEIKLPIGATALDFAFASDPARARYAIGARVNGSEVALSATLDYGSVVEVIYQKDETIEPIWLSWARTTDAAEKVKQYLQGRDGLWHMQKGKKSIDQAAADYFLEWENLEKTTWMDDFIPVLNEKLNLKIRDHIELVQKVGEGEIDPTEMVKIFMDYYQREVLQVRESEPDKYRRNFKVSVQVPNEPGILNQITDAVKTLRINVESDASYPEKSGGSTIKLVLLTYSSIQRDQVLNVLQGIGNELKKADKQFNVTKYEYISDEKLKEFVDSLRQA